MLNSAFYKIFFQNETLFAHADDARSLTSPSASEDVEQAAPVLNTGIEAAAEVTPYPYKILVLVDNPRQKDLDASEGVLLYKILKAVGYDSEDTDILNVGWLEGQALQNELQSRAAHYLISFGVPLKKLFMDLLLNPYEPTAIGKINFLLADPLSVVEADVDVKKRLWAALKVMFPGV